MSVAAAGLTAAALWGPAGARAATPSTVTATITDSRIVFAPSSVPTGTIVITVVNRTKDRRYFGVGTRRTGVVAAGRSERLTVTLTTSGEQQFSSIPAAGSRHGTTGSRRLTAALDLFVPCSVAAATTVDVQIDQSAGGLTISPTTVPCGTVTFDITDVDTANARLLVAADAPPRSGLSTQLSPGGTATFTLNFPAAAVAHCGAVSVGGDGIVVILGSALLTLH